MDGGLRPVGWVPDEDTVEALGIAVWRVAAPGVPRAPQPRWYAVLCDDQLQVTVRHRGASKHVRMSVEVWTDIGVDGLWWMLSDALTDLNRCVDRGWFDLVKRGRDDD